MTATEDAVRSTIQAHTEAAALPLDGHAMLTRIRNTQCRRRRARRVGSAVAALAVACTAGIGCGLARTADPTTAVAPGAATRTVAVDNLTMQVPEGWLVTGIGPDTMRRPYWAMTPGPYISTVPTGDMCRNITNGIECSRANGIITVPSDGVITWLSFGATGSPGTSEDPGYAPWGQACNAPTGTPFHAFRLLNAGQGPIRVALDGCIYGPHTTTRSEQLNAIIDSIHLTTPPPSSSP